MKCHISATIDDQLVKELRKMSNEEKRSFSNLIEIAIERLLRENPASAGLVTTAGRFTGKFNRAEIYEWNHR